MCGIAGWYARGGTAVAEPVIAAQLDTIVHRGPDDAGVLTDGDFGFGMRRLSIIDLAGGHQPINSPDGRRAIVFNGEIYNHPSLRAELIAAGRAFATHSDTETILAAFEHWGEDAWRRLDGMFAVAIWDRAERRLTLARDPMGIKPLYVTGQNGGIAFASELKALFPLPGHRFELSPRAAYEYFCAGYVRPPRSIYADVYVLEPGHTLTIDRSGGARSACFASPRFGADDGRTADVWIEEFRQTWRENVLRHLLADVEVGAFLSGGIDSSAIVAAMTQVSDAPVKTFTIGFPVARYDESPVAAAVAAHLGTDHHRLMVDLQAARDVLPQLQRCYDEPFADPSAAPTWYLSRLAREHVKVVLSGDGGDELFMGYKHLLTEQRLGTLPAPVRRLAAAVTRVPPTPSRAFNRRLARWQKAAGTAALPDGASRFLARSKVTSAAQRARLFAPDFLAALPDVTIAALRREYFPDLGEAAAMSDVEQFTYADLTLNLPGQMLTKVDRASMAHSLEVRTPFLSPSFSRWAMTVPTRLKLHRGTGKYILREAIRPWMPAGVVDRRKQGFAIPLAEWFDGDFNRYVRELWQDGAVRTLGIFDPAAVEATFAEHSSGRRDHGRFLYTLAMFSLWAEADQARRIEATRRT